MKICLDFSEYMSLFWSRANYGWERQKILVARKITSFFCLNHVFRAYQNPEYILLGVMRFCYVRFIMRKKKIGGNVCMEILFGEKGEIGSPGWKMQHRWFCNSFFIPEKEDEGTGRTTLLVSPWTINILCVYPGNYGVSLKQYRTDCRAILVS